MQNDLIDLHQRLASLKRRQVLLIAARREADDAISYLSASTHRLQEEIAVLRRKEPLVLNSLVCHENTSGGAAHIVRALCGDRVWIESTRVKNGNPNRMTTANPKHLVYCDRKGFPLNMNTATAIIVPAFGEPEPTLTETSSWIIRIDPK